MSPRNILRACLILLSLTTNSVFSDSGILLDSCSGQLTSSFKKFWNDESRMEIFGEFHQNRIDEVLSGSKEYVLLKQAFEVPSELPSSRTPLLKNLCSSERALLRISQLLQSIPVGYRAENNGTLIPDMIPQLKFAETQSSQSTTELWYHTDIGFIPDGLSPVFMGLAGLRMHEDAYTYMYPVDRVLKVLDAASIEHLKSPTFNLTSPESFRFQRTNYSHLLHSPLIPLLYPCLHLEGKLCVRMGTSVQATTDGGGRALNSLYAILPTVRETLRIEPGDILLFDNHRVLHGRSEFTPAYNDEDRWVQKLYMNPRRLLSKYGFDSAELDHIVFETRDFLPFLASDQASLYYTSET